MLTYILKRILLIIPTLLAISLITFTISQQAPGDPVSDMVGGGEESVDDFGELESMQKAYILIRHELGLDLPVFYLSLRRSSYPDSLHRIPYREHRSTLEGLLDRYGNWFQIQDYYHSLRNFEKKLLAGNNQNKAQLLPLLGKLYLADQPENIFKILAEMNILAGDLTVEVQHLMEYHTRIEQKQSAWKNYIPVIHFYGLNNQYHRWITKFVKGDFGKSYQDKRPIASTLWPRMKWTLLLTLLALTLTYLIAIPLGVSSAVKRGTKLDRVISTSLFVLYSLPNFWIATLLILFFGGALGWFPIYGLGKLSAEAPFWNRFWETAHHMVLPVICFAYPSFAFLSRQMRGGLISSLSQDYIRTAKAKGLPETEVVWKHALRNSLLPIITLFGSVFPMAIGGSIVLEYIFSIPGMGNLGYYAVLSRDYPVVYTVMMFSAILTLVGYLISDILYAWVDPRITYTKKHAE